MRISSLSGSGALVEIQASAEGAVFSEAELASMMALAKAGIVNLVALQKQTLLG